MTNTVGISNISFISFQDDDQSSVSSPNEDVAISGIKKHETFKYNKTGLD
jgi:hypothetical protein